VILKTWRDVQKATSSEDQRVATELKIMRQWGMSASTLLNLVQGDHARNIADAYPA
jgi:hypothetical protein